MSNIIVVSLLDLYYWNRALIRRIVSFALMSDNICDSVVTPMEEVIAHWWVCSYHRIIFPLVERQALRSFMIWQSTRAHQEPFSWHLSHLAFDAYPQLRSYNCSISSHTIRNQTRSQSSYCMQDNSQMQSYRVVENYAMKKSNDSTLLQTQCKISDDIRHLNHHNSDKIKKSKSLITISNQTHNIYRGSISSF